MPSRHGSLSVQGGRQGTPIVLTLRWHRSKNRGAVRYLLATQAVPVALKISKTRNFQLRMGLKWVWARLRSIPGC